MPVYRTRTYERDGARALAGERRESRSPVRPARAEASVRRPLAARPRVRRDHWLPSWEDLQRRGDRPARAHPLTSISTGRFVLLVLALATAFTFYVGHVHATQEELLKLQVAQRENLRLHLKYNRLKGEFDRATGPSMIYDRAHALGLEEGIANGPTIRLK